MFKTNCEESAEKSGLSTQTLMNYLEIAKEASKKGGKQLLSHYGLLKTIENKGRPGDLVTNADIEAENLIVSFLKDKTPDCGIYAEESGYSEGNSSFEWCIDPLDGTTNYAHGYPFFACSIGLIWKNRPLLGAINVPFLKEMFLLL